MLCFVSALMRHEIVHSFVNIIDFVAVYAKLQWYTEDRSWNKR